MIRKLLANRWLLASAALAALGLTAFWLAPGLHGKPTATDEPSSSRDVEAVVVTLATPTVRAVERHVEVVGTLEGYEEVSIAPKVEGRIVRIHHDVGDEVGPGEPLLDIDDTDYRLGVLEAQRGLELELARLGLTELPKDGLIDFKRVPGVMRARNMEENSRTVLDRARRLGVTRVIGAEELERTQMEFRVAASNREQAELEARAILASARLRQAQLETARQKLLDACVRVPCPSPSRMPPGCTNPKALRYVVAARKIAEGEIVRVFPAGTLFRLVIDRPLKLVATLPERFISEVQSNQTVSLEVEAYPGQKFTGRVARINPTVDRVNRTFSVEVLVGNESGKLRPGGFVKARVLTRRADSALTVPEEAIVRFAGVVKVFVVEAGKARAVPVRPGEVVAVRAEGRTRRWVEVEGPLPTGLPVVTSGHSQLAEQTPVRVR